MSATLGLAALLGLALAPNQAVAQDTRRMALSEAEQPATNTCPDRGEIEGLNPQGDGFLAVRTGPGTEHEQIDELHNGDVVMLCDYRYGWHRVVYPGEGQEATKCNTRTEQSADPFRGPCRSGWVHGNWVRWIWQ